MAAARRAGEAPWPLTTPIASISAASGARRRRETALEAADSLAAALPEDLLRVEVPPMADWLESFVGMRLHMLVRFGLWDELLAQPLPEDPALYCVTTALTHYARGVAFAATARVAEAEGERNRLTAAIGRVPDLRCETTA